MFYVFFLDFVLVQHDKFNISFFNFIIFYFSNDKYVKKREKKKSKTTTRAHYREYVLREYSIYIQTRIYCKNIEQNIVLREHFIYNIQLRKSILYIYNQDKSTIQNTTSREHSTYAQTRVYCIKYNFEETSCIYAIKTRAQYRMQFRESILYIRRQEYIAQNIVSNSILLVCN